MCGRLIRELAHSTKGSKTIKLKDRDEGLKDIKRPKRKMNRDTGELIEKTDEAVISFLQ